MSHIVTVQEAVTAFEPWMEPTFAELDAIELEMPVITADVELLDAYITTLDRTPTELDARRIRRARRRALAARLALAKRGVWGGGVMGRRFKDMQTPEQQYAARQAQRPASSSQSSVRPATHSEWREMTAHQQAAHLARLEGREGEAREWERMGAQAAAADAASETKPKKRGWFR